MRRSLCAVLAVLLLLPGGAGAGWDKSKPPAGPLNSPFVSVDIRNNWAALESAVGSANLVADPTFLIWATSDAAAPTHWGVAGTGVAIARAGTGLGDTSRKVGAFTAKVTSGTATATLQQSLLPAGSYDDGFDGVPFSACAWIRASNATTARVYIADGAGTTFSSYHTGGGAYEWLCATRTIDNAAVGIAVGSECAATTRVCYTSGFTAVLGEVPPARFAPAEQVHEERVCLIAGVQTVATDKVGTGCRMRFARPVIIKGVTLDVQTAAPTGAAILVDVNHFDGSAFQSMFTTRPQIAAASAVGAEQAPDGVYRYRCFAAAHTATNTDVLLSVDVDQIGSGTPGTDLYVRVRYMMFTRPLENFLAYNADN